MEKHKILGLTLLGAGAAAAGLGIYGTVQALQLNNQTSDTKAKESKAMNNVIDSVYGSTESSAKAMGTASGLLAGAAAGGGLILLTTGGLLLSPLGIKMKQMKLAKMGAISLAVIAGGAPVLGAIGTGLFYTDQVQQAKQFLDFSADFEKEFMGNINAVEDRAREMLDMAGWLEFKDILKTFETDANAFKITDADKTANEDLYYKHVYLVAANMYVMAGKGLLDTVAGNTAESLKSANYFTDKAFWGTHTDLFDKLNSLKQIRDNFLPDKFDEKTRTDFNKAHSLEKLDALEKTAVAQAAKSSTEWLKKHMKSYNDKFGQAETDKVISIVLAKLAYVSGNDNLSISTKDGATTDVQILVDASGTQEVLKNKFLVPSTLTHFESVPGIAKSADGKYFELAKPLSETIGIDELTTKYKPSWLNDKIQYIFTEPAAGRTKIDEAEYLKIASQTGNKFINTEFLKNYFANGHSLYIDNSKIMTQFTDLDTSVNGGLVFAGLFATGPAKIDKVADSTLTAFIKTLAAVKAAPTATPIPMPLPQIFTQTASSYFLQMKLTLAKNYVQSVMNEISDTLTNHATDIYA